MPRLKKSRRKFQYGGTKVSNRIFACTGKSADWKPITDDKSISLLFLKNFISIKKVSSESVCSMILVGTLDPNGDVKKRSQIYKTDGTLLSSVHRADRPRFVNEGLEQPYVCMKISLVKTNKSTVGRVEWDETPTKKIRKVVTTVNDANKELEEQKEMHSDLLCWKDAVDVIPDGIASYVITPNMFYRYVIGIKIRSKEFDDETIEVLDWIVTSAKTHMLDIHIAFMDYLEGFITLSKFFKGTPASTQETISYKATAVVLELLLKSSIASWDLNSGNILTDGTRVKFVDFGRTYHFNIKSDEDKLKQYISKLWVDSPEYSEGLLHFFNINDCSRELEDQFDIHYTRLLETFPNEKYQFQSLPQNTKRKQIYESLIFLAFIDGMSKKCNSKNCNVDLDGFQCSSIMIRAFHNEHAFRNLDEFLNYFTLDYEMFLLKQTEEFVHQLNHGLDQISHFLELTLVPCPLYKRSVGYLFRYDSDSEDEDLPPQEQMPVGGKKRRHTQKKRQIRKYYRQTYRRNKHCCSSRRRRRKT